MIRKGQLMKSKSLDVSLEETMPMLMFFRYVQGSKVGRRNHTLAGRTKQKESSSKQRKSHVQGQESAKTVCVGVGTRCGFAQ